MRCIAVLYSKPFENFIAPYTTEYRYMLDLLTQAIEDGSANLDASHASIQEIKKGWNLP